MIVAEEEVYRGWTRLRRIAFRMPDGAVVERHLEDHGSAVAVLPFDPARRCALLVSMPRAPVVAAGEADLLEVVAGALDGEDPVDCARREAIEEAGVHLASLERVTRVWSMPTLSSETIECFLAPYASSDRIAAGGGVIHEHENITVHEIDLNRLAAFSRDGTIRDMKTLVLIQALQLRRPELFT